MFDDLNGKGLMAAFMARTLAEDQTLRLQETIAVCSAKTFPPVPETPESGTLQ